MKIRGRGKSIFAPASLENIDYFCIKSCNTFLGQHNKVRPLHQRAVGTCLGVISKGR